MKMNIDLSKYRAELSTWNLIGKKVFTVKAEPCDLMHNDRVKNNDPTRMVKPIMKYIIESTEILGANVVLAPDNVTPLIELNNDASLQFKIAPMELREVNMDSVRDALEYKPENGRQPILFQDCIKLTEQVNRLNAMERAKCDEEAERLLAMSSMLEDLNKSHLSECDKYYDELGLSSK